MAEIDLATILKFLSDAIAPQAAAAETNQGKPTTPQEDLNSAVKGIQDRVTTPDSQLGIGDFFVKGLEWIANEYPEMFSDKAMGKIDEEKDKEKAVKKNADENETDDAEDNVFKKFLDLFSESKNGGLSLNLDAGSSSGTSTASKNARSAEDDAFTLSLKS